MKKWTFFLLFMIVATSFLPLCAVSPEKTAAVTADSAIGKTRIAVLEQKIIDISSNAKKSVVSIKSTKRVVGRKYADPFYDLFQRFFKGPRRRYKRYNPKKQAMGSGFVIDRDNGYIVTNAHVIAEAEDITVTLDRRDYSAKIVGVDKDTDVGIIKLEKFRKKNLRELTFADSDSLKVGSFAIAVGNPFGLSNTVTFGVVSATGRSGVNVAEYEDFIQTDAAINPGNSGGPLLNKNGRVIGMNTAIFSKSGGYMGIGFAVPANMMKRIAAQLISGKKVKRAYMGVTIQELTDKLKKHLGTGVAVKGVLITSVSKNSPAQKAGIRAGDIITMFGGKLVPSPAKLKNTVAFSSFGKRYPVKIIRDGNKKTLKIVLKKDFSFNTRPGENYSDDFGFTFTDGDSDSIVITDIDDGSLAMAAGLRKGDIILSVNRKKVKNAKHLHHVMKKHSALLILIERDGGRFFVSLNK